MLHQTFIHIPGIGKETERGLWKHGIRSWDDADKFEKRFGAVGARLHQKLDEYIPLSREAVRRKDAAFFERLSTLGEAWRVFPEFADECVYLDIETTGLSSVFDMVTMVGLYDGRKYKVFVEGDNLQELPSQLLNYSVVVTFNGAGFDLRFLKLAFPELKLPPIHIDLRWITRKLGMKGGLKSVEEKFGLKRAESGNKPNVLGDSSRVLIRRSHILMSPPSLASLGEIRPLGDGAGHRRVRDAAARSGPSTAGRPRPARSSAPACRTASSPPAAPRSTSWRTRRPAPCPSP